MGAEKSHFCRLMLQRALEDQPISQQKFERLNLGLSAFATLNILLLATSLVSPEGSIHFPLRYTEPPFGTIALPFCKQAKSCCPSFFTSELPQSRKVPAYRLHAGSKKALHALYLL